MKELAELLSEGWRTKAELAEAARERHISSWRTAFRQLDDAGYVAYDETKRMMFRKPPEREPVDHPDLVVSLGAPSKAGSAAGRRFAPSWLRKEILERDGYHCRYCRRPLTDAIANIDHVIPWPWGLTEASNLVASCRPCNQAKGSRTNLPGAKPR